MYRWIPYAFVRIAFFYCAGIVLGIQFPNLIDISTNVIAFVGLATTFCVCVIRHRGKSILAGALAAFALVSAGLLNVSLTNELSDEHHLAHVTDTVNSFRVVVRSSAQERPRTNKYEVPSTRSLWMERGAQRSRGHFSTFRRIPFPDVIHMAMYF